MTQFEARCFTKHGFDMIMLFKKSRTMADQSIVNKRAHSLYMAREHDSQYSGLVKSNASEFVHSLSQVECETANNLSGINQIRQ